MINAVIRGIFRTGELSVRFAGWLEGRAKCKAWSSKKFQGKEQKVLKFNGKVLGPY